MFQPEDWDDEEDGEWTAPTIPNPEYKGEWKPKVCKILMFSYRLVTVTFRTVVHDFAPSVQKIKNPNYKGKWKVPMIDNPNFSDDPDLYVFPNLKYVGIELWQVIHFLLRDFLIVFPWYSYSDDHYV